MTNRLDCRLARGLTTLATVACLVASPFLPAASAGTLGLQFYAVRLQPPAGASGSETFGFGNAASAGGFAAGHAEVSGLDDRAVRWDAAGQATRLKDVAGQSTIRSYAFGVNGDGTVAGFAQLQGGGSRAVRWDAMGNASLLDALPTQTGPSYALGVAGSEVAVGYGGFVDGSHAIQWDAAGSAVRLGQLAGQTATNSIAYSVATDGTVAGRLDRQTVGGRAVRWSAAGDVTLLDDVSGQTTTFSAANSAASGGVVAGNASLAGLGTRAIRWDAAGVATRLGDVANETTTFSIAYGVAGDGTTAGFATLAGVGDRAVLWNADGDATLLQDLLGPAYAGWTLTDARGLDSDGQFLRTVASGTDAQGNSGLFLLTAVVPEPVSALGGLSMLGLVALRRRATSA